MQTNLGQAAPRTLAERMLRGRWIGKVLLVALLAYATWAIGRQAVQAPALFIEQVKNGVQLRFVYAMIALGYTMVYGIVRLVNFARAEVRDLLSLATGVGKTFVAASLIRRIADAGQLRRAHRRCLPSIPQARQWTGDSPLPLSGSARSRRAAVAWRSSMFLAARGLSG